MTNDEKWEFIKRKVDEIQAIDEELSEIMRFLNLPPESALLSPAYKLMDIAIKAMDMLIDDSDSDWLAWFVYENKFGCKGYKARKEGMDYTTVRSIDDLRKVVTATHGEGGDNDSDK